MRYTPIVVIVPAEVLERDEVAEAEAGVALMLAENPDAAAVFKSNGWTAQSFALGMLLDAALES